MPARVRLAVMRDANKAVRFATAEIASGSPLSHSHPGGYNATTFSLATCT